MLDARKLYQHLPRTDCKECGEQGCFVFATKLFLGEKLPQDCIVLEAPKNSLLKKTIQEILAPIKL
ncbi:MAG: (Fe-S)-binding protein [Candidatus Bathyarchaeia archaeon]